MVIHLTDMQVVKDFFITDKKLFMTCMPDDDVRQFQEKTWYPNKNTIYLGYYKEDKLISIMRCDMITNITRSLHMYLKSEYWGKDLSHHICEEQIKKIHEITKCLKVLVEVPDCCEQVIKTALKLGFIGEGYLNKSILWRGKLHGIYILSKFINRSQ